MEGKMKFRDREGNQWEQESSQDQFLAKLYGAAFGRFLLKFLTLPWLSEIGGALLDSRVSKIAISPFVQKNQIDLSQYEDQKYHSYNDFFTRKIRSEMRPIAEGDDVLISPCDGKISAYPIETTGQFFIKHSPYTVESLTRSKKLAKRFKGGTVVLIRLTVEDYHRYCYAAGGLKSRNYYLKGKFHTVNPIACEYYPVYKENAREYTLIRTEQLGVILQMEVGALMVGRITNYEGKTTVCRGEEKGRFEFGGSTVVLLLERGKVLLDSDLFLNTQEGYETIVKQGEKIGVSVLSAKKRRI